MTGNQRKAHIYYTAIAGDYARKQNIKVVNALGQMRHPVTLRVLHQTMNARGFKIELQDLRRSITNLSKADPHGRWLNQWGKAVVEIAHESPCPITKKLVGWYRLVPNAFATELFANTTQTTTP